MNADDFINGESHIGHRILRGMALGDNPFCDTCGVWLEPKAVSAEKERE